MTAAMRMKRSWPGFALIAVASLAMGSAKGTVPRDSASAYPAHAEKNGVAVGARLLTSNEAEHAFVSDVNRCCFVVEFAVYPQKDLTIDISGDDFALVPEGSQRAEKPSSAAVVASTLQKNAQAQTNIDVAPSVGIGYQKGTTYDPALGTTRGSGVYTQAGVGVGVGGGDNPGSSAADRRAMELELSEKGLPEGSASSPVAGYLYFPRMGGKKHKDKVAPRQLVYTLNGEKIVLDLR
jgi:hypothetical protein